MGMKLQRASLNISLAAESSGGGWIQLFPLGKQQGFDGRGPYLLEDASAVVAASMREKVDLVIDRDHAFDLLPAGAERPAAGWIKEMVARDDGIYGRVEWTSRAAQQIADKEYRYFSPTFLHTKEGKVLRILRGSLTNVPNLEIKAVAAAESNETENPQQEKDTMNETLKAIAKLLGLPDDATEAAILEACKGLLADFAKVKENVGATAAASSADIIKKIEEKISTAAAKKAETEEADPTKFVPIAAFQELQKTVASMQTATATDKAHAEVDAAVKAGKLAPSLKDWGLAYASKDLEAFKKFVDNSPVVVASGAENKGGNGGGGATIDDDQKSLCSQLGIKPDAFKAAQKQSA